jgi:5S rRNA maturation endonuclease (ribonuclease M5)
VETEAKVILEEIRKLSLMPIIIVEGKKDKAALENLGVKNIITLRNGIEDFCQKISSKYPEAAILTDLDKEGKKLYSKIRYSLEREGVKINDNFRNFLFKETSLRQIEGTSSYLFSLSKKKAAMPSEKTAKRKSPP